MEIRRSFICLAVVVLGVFSHCSEARHSLHRRDADANYEDSSFFADGPTDDEAQNDAEGNDDDGDVVANGTILTNPESYQVNIGKTVRLECKVSPINAGLVINWYKNNELYFQGQYRTHVSDNSTSNITLDFGSSDLMIYDVKPSDTGRYKCEIMQIVPVSIEHTVLVLEAPRITSFRATDGGRLVEGSDLLLTCEAEGAPKPEIIWSRVLENGGNEKLTEKDGKFSANSFFSSNVKTDISGYYYCYAFNTAGHSEANLTIIVSGKPRVHVHRTVVNTDVNVQAELQCSAHVDPTPHIRWYKDGKLIEDSSSQFTISTDGARSKLTVTPTTDQDFGTFTCEAENRHGKHNRSIELVQRPVVENFDVDGPKLSWTVHSHQPLEEIELQLRNLNGDNEWRTINVPLPEKSEQKKHEYDITYVIENKNLEAGKYEATVRVKNEKDWSKHTEPTFVDIIEDQTQPLQIASIFPGSNAHSIRPTTAAVLSTTFMYLLVRML